LDVVADKIESQDICFVPDGDHAAGRRTPIGRGRSALASGPFVTTAGDVIGEHDGFVRYTVGQRRGLPVGSSRPLYVVAIRPEDRAVVIGPRDELFGHSVVAREVIGSCRPRHQSAPTSRCRSGNRPHRYARRSRHLEMHDGPTAGRGGEIELSLATPVAAIAPGQSVVLYAMTVLLGGGVIEGQR